MRVLRVPRDTDMVLGYQAEDGDPLRDLDNPMRTLSFYGLSDQSVIIARSP